LSWPLLGTSSLRLLPWTFFGENIAPPGKLENARTEENLILSIECTVNPEQCTI